MISGATEISAWPLDIRIIAALIGVFAFILSQVANAAFVSLRDRKQKLLEKVDIACFARAELINIKLHHQANIIKLESILDMKDFGAEIDYEKMKLSDSGLVALDLSKVYVLKQELTQDLLRLSLYSRNNDLEIANTATIVHGNHTDAEKIRAIKLLKGRFDTTVRVAVRLSEQLAEYSSSPTRYDKQGISWPDSLYKLKKEMESSDDSRGSRSGLHGGQAYLDQDAERK